MVHRSLPPLGEHLHRPGMHARSRGGSSTGAAVTAVAGVLLGLVVMEAGARDCSGRDVKVWDGAWFK